MSLNINGERLLAEALADAMDRDLESVPSKGELRAQHHFSGSFEREMRKLEKQTTRGTDVAESDKAAVYPARRWRRYGAWAAAFVCVIGLAAVAASGGLFHTGAKNAPAEGEMAVADGAAAESEEEETWDTTTDQTGAADRMQESYDEEIDGADNGSYAAALPEDGADEKVAAPDWQTQLLLESAKADEWVDWNYGQLCDDGSIILETITNENLTEETGIRQLRVSDIYEVYYEQTDGEWTRVYYTSDRQNGVFRGGEQEEQWYLLSDLNMTQSGTYRLVRQVNQYRQMLQLQVEVQ